MTFDSIGLFTTANQLIPLLITLLLAGALAGLIAGLFGIGGGVVIVPTLAWALTGLGFAEVAMHTAVGSSLATIIATSIKSAAAHHKKGAVDWAIVRVWAPWIILGAIGGATVASLLPGKTLKGLFGLVGLVLAAQFVFGSPSWRLAAEAPKGLPRMGLGAGLGSMSAIMGIGGGTFGVTLLTLVGRPMHQAVGTAAAFGALVGVPGAIGFVLSGWGNPSLAPFSLGYVNLPAVLIMGLLTVNLAGVGARLAHRLDGQKLKRLFGVALALVSLSMLYSWWLG